MFLSPTHIPTAIQDQKITANTKHTRYLTTLEFNLSGSDRTAYVRSWLEDSKLKSYKGLLRAVRDWVDAEHEERDRQSDRKWQRSTAIGRNEDGIDRESYEDESEQQRYTREMEDWEKDAEESWNEEDLADDQVSIVRNRHLSMQVKMVRLPWCRTVFIIESLD